MSASGCKFRKNSAGVNALRDLGRKDMFELFNTSGFIDDVKVITQAHDDVTPMDDSC